MTTPASALPPGVTPLRAGQHPGGADDPGRALAALDATAARTLFADISEFQPDIADGPYLAWSKAIIIRCAYGDAHDDRAWYGGARRKALHDGGVKFLGIYQYLVAGQDPVAQADAFIRIVGKLQPGEVPVCDLEEGAGNQWPRYWAWRQRIMGEYPQLAHTPLGSPVLYSGLFFAQQAGLGHPDWLADYTTTEPSFGQRFWQFSSSYTVPGVGKCDCSLAHMTSDQMHALVTPGSTPAPAQKHWQEWDTAGTLSLAAFAAKLEVGPATLLSQTAVHFGYFNGPLGNYIKGLADGTVKPTDPMPKGCKLWVQA